MSEKCQSRHLAPQQNRPLLDHLVGAAEQRQRHVEAERLGGPEIEDQLDLRGLLDRQVSGLLALENAAGVDAALTVRIRKAVSVADEAACYSVLSKWVHRAWRKANAASCWLRLLKNGSLPITSAAARSLDKVAK